MRFIIIASPRTGSSHLVNMLGAHPEIFCHGNVFAPQMMPIFWPKAELLKRDQISSTKAELLSLRSANPGEFLERIFATCYGRRHIGFKIFRGQNDVMLDKMVKDKSIGKIVLFRSNVLANYSSRLAARRTGSWDAKAGGMPVSAPKVQFLEDKFVAFHDRYISFYRKITLDLLGSRQTFGFINYEELNDPLFLGGVINFLGAAPEISISEGESTRTQVKQNPSDIMSRFSNPDEVEEFLGRHNLHHWKHEGETSLEMLGSRPTGPRETSHL